MTRSMCPACKKKLLVESTGSEKSPILLVGEQPGFDDIKSGKAYFEGKVGDALRHEMQIAGINMRDCRTTLLWKHAIDEKDCDLSWHLDQLVKEFKGKTHILLMGPKILQAFNFPGGNWSGLEIDLPPFQSMFVPAPSVLALLSAPLGDWRFSLATFQRLLKADEKKSPTKKRK